MQFHLYYYTFFLLTHNVASRGCGQCRRLLAVALCVVVNKNWPQFLRFPRTAVLINPLSAHHDIDEGATGCNNLLCMPLCCAKQPLKCFNPFNQVFRQRKKRSIWLLSQPLPCPIWVTTLNRLRLCNGKLPMKHRAFWAYTRIYNYCGAP